MSADDLIPLVRASLLATAREYNLPAVIRSLELNDWRRAKEGFDEAVTSEHDAALLDASLAACALEKGRVREACAALAQSKGWTLTRWIRAMRAEVR